MSSSLEILCMYVYFYLHSQVHTGYKPNYMEANAIMRQIKKKIGGGRRRTVATRREDNSGPKSKIAQM